MLRTHLAAILLHPITHIVDGLLRFSDLLAASEQRDDAWDCFETGLEKRVPNTRDLYTDTAASAAAAAETLFII